MRFTADQFTTKALLVHNNKYSYTNTDYKSMSLKIDIECSIHGMFSQRAGSHLMGSGCPKCKGNLIAEVQKDRAKAKRTDVSHIIVPEGSKAVPLNNGKYALVDEEDYERVMQYNWHVSNGYTKTLINGLSVSMHRFVMNVTDPKILVDHKFHNRLDNRKSQLRTCNKSKNGMNSIKRKGCTSQYKGVLIQNKNWVAKITSGGVVHYLGSFEKEEEAARAYDTKAVELHGEFARLNFKLEK